MNEYEKARFYIDLFHGMKRRGYDVDTFEGIKVKDLADLSNEQVRKLGEEYG